MSSGFGRKGVQSRCFAHWMDFNYCMTQAKTEEECKSWYNDYLECLHRDKEAARHDTIMETWEAKAASGHLPSPSEWFREMRKKFG